MAELNFSTGLVPFTINGKCEISFNPTDSAFVERLFNAFDTLDNKQEDYKRQIEKAAGNRSVFEVARQLDAEMRDIVDGALGSGVCTQLFGEMNVYALAEGLPVWCNLMLAIMDEVDTGFAREQKKTNPRIQKYTAKYHK